MNYNRLKQYVAFREALQEEKANLESRLEKINEALGVSSEQAAPSPNRAPAPRRAGGGRRRRIMSEEAKARIAAAQRARWARIKGQSGAAPAAARSSSRPRRGGMSPEQRAKIAAAQTARWARIRAAKGK